MKLLVLAVSVTIAFAAANAGDDSAKQEMKKLEGTWTLVNGEMDGKAIPASDVKTASLVIKGNHHSVHIGRLAIEGTHTVDPAKDPKAIDGLDDSADGKKQKRLGIYQVDGENFEVCFAPPGKVRPTQFNTQPDIGRFRLLWKRVK